MKQLTLSEIKKTLKNGGISHYNHFGKQIKNQGYATRTLNTADYYKNKKSTHTILYVDKNQNIIQLYCNNWHSSNTGHHHELAMLVASERSRLKIQLSKDTKNIKKIVKNYCQKTDLNYESLIEEIENNFQNSGYCSKHLIRRGKIDNKLIESMKVARIRHEFTSYDDINKEGLNDYQVRELRRTANRLAMQDKQNTRAYRWSGCFVP